MMSSNNNTIVKQVVGIDVAQKELVVQWGRVYADLRSELYASKTFANTEPGFRALVQWTARLCTAAAPVRYVLEATGVYHEALACFLHAAGEQVSIVLPSRISHYMRTLEQKTVNDHSCAAAICRFGLERALAGWRPPHPVYKRLRQLTRERDQLVCARTVAKNQLHAEGAEASPHAGSVRRLRAQVALFDGQIAEITAEVAGLVRGDEGLRRTVGLMTSVPGVGVLTAVTLIGETDGFALVRNKKQLVSYAGLDVREKQSGSSVRGRSRISRHGNRYLRKALHFPALTALRVEGRFRALFLRLVARHGVKMKAVVAVQRKVLEIVYAVVKTGRAFERTGIGAPAAAAAAENS